MARPSSGIGISGSAETSCSIRPIGKIGVRSGGPAGSPVCGLSGGSGSPGRSGRRFTHAVGICDSSSWYLTGSAPKVGRFYVLARALPARGAAAVAPAGGTLAAARGMRIRTGEVARGEEEGEGTGHDRLLSDGGQVVPD